MGQRVRALALRSSIAFLFLCLFWLLLISNVVIIDIWFAVSLYLHWKKKGFIRMPVGGSTDKQYLSDKLASLLDTAEQDLPLRDVVFRVIRMHKGARFENVILSVFVSHASTHKLFWFSFACLSSGKP